MSNLVTRREVSACLLSLVPVLGFVSNGTASIGEVPSSEDDGISRTCECIHQEVVFKTSCARVYHALTDAKQFSKVTEFVMPGAAATISPDVGGAFSLFGGVITGRHIELVPGERLVQAWREKNWDPGVFSMVRFQLSEQGSDAKLVFDQTAIPEGHAGHLAPGWKTHYWEPLQKYLA